VNPYLQILEQHYDFALGKRRIDPESSPIRPVVESYSHTLYLHAGKTHTMYKVLKRKKYVAIFERVVIGPKSDYDIYRSIGDDFLDHIVDLVGNDGLISSLVFTKCLFRYDRRCEFRDFSKRITWRPLNSHTSKYVMATSLMSLKL
jgi:hypothetical protein